MLGFLKYEFTRKSLFKNIIGILFIFILMDFTVYKYVIRFKSINIRFNCIDYIFILLTEPKNICNVIVLGFIFFINDIIFDYIFQNQVFIRIKSRKLWWNTKVLVLFLKTIIYMVYLMIFSLVFSFLTFPISNNWSTSLLGLKKNVSISEVSLDGLYVLSKIAKFQTPQITFLQLLILVTLSLLIIGFTIMIITLLFNNRIIGFLSGLFWWIILLVPIYEFKTTIIDNVLFNHIIYVAHNTSSYSFFIRNIMYSVIYLIILNILLYFIGYKLSIKKEFIEKGENE